MDANNVIPINARRFWARVRRASVCECWEWQGERTKKGYGRVDVGGRHLKAHRVAFLLVNGRWPAPHCLHTCDNPPCCNPAHLMEGTNAENSRQAVERGLVPRGTAKAGAKINEWQACGIMARMLMGGVQRDVAEEWGITREHVNDIWRRRQWGWLFRGDAEE